MLESTAFTTPDSQISCESGSFGVHCVDTTPSGTGFSVGDGHARLLDDGHEQRI